MTSAVIPTPTLVHPVRIAHRVRGFTLMEIAIVMLIVALLLGGMLMPLSGQQELRARLDTEKIIAEARDALIGFALANERLPCPASTTSNGLESFCTNATGGCGTALTTPQTHGRCSNPHDGFLPAATLGIAPINPQGYALDGWGTTNANRLRYAVTDYNTNSVYPFTYSQGMKTVFSSINSSDLRICNSGAAVLNPGTTSADCSAGNALAVDAAAVIYSLGKNANTSGATANENHNPNPQSTLAADRVFVQVQPEANFDDQLLWISRGILFGRMVSASRLP